MVRLNCCRKQTHSSKRIFVCISTVPDFRSARGASLMGWSSCTTTRQHHDPERLLLTALLPACTVGRLLYRVHRIARHYQIRLGCGCVANETVVTSKTDHLSADENLPRPGDETPAGDVGGASAVENSSLDLLADLALQTGMTTSTIKKCEESLKEDNAQEGLMPDAPVYDRRGGVETSARRSLDSSTVGVLLPPHTWIHKPDQQSPPACRPGSDLATNIPPIFMDGDSPAGSRANPKYRVLQLHHPDSPGTLLAFQVSFSPYCFYHNSIPKRFCIS